MQISFIFFTACANKYTVYSIDNNTLTLGKDKDSKVSIRLTNPQIIRHPSFCVNDSYTIFDRNIHYGNLFIEKIDLDSSCEWEGLPISFFQSNLKHQLKINKLQKVEEFDIAGYNFITYEVNNSYLNVIYIYSGGQDRFILDYYGRLFDKVLKSFKPDYVNKYLAKKRFLGEYNDSLVRKNIIEHYFKREQIRIIPRIGISISL